MLGNKRIELLTKLTSKSPSKSTTTDLTHIQLEIILAMLNDNPKLRRILKLYF